MEARQSRYLETHARILQAAGKLFATRGYLGVTYDDVAAGSGRGVGTVLRHFGTKANLARELVLEQRRRFRAVALAAESRGSDQGSNAVLQKVCIRAAGLVDSDPVVRGGLRLLSESPPEVPFPKAWPFGEWRSYIILQLIRSEGYTCSAARERSTLLTAFLVGAFISFDAGSCVARVQSGIAVSLPHCEPVFSTS